MQNNNLKPKTFLNPWRCFALFALRFKFNRGFGLIEILIASAILSASLITLTATTQISFRIMKESLERTQAGFLAEEGIEVMRIFRDDGWDEHIAPIASETENYFAFSTTTSAWSLSSTLPEPIEGLFARTVVLDDVYRRNSDGEIVEESSSDPKTLDPDTKKATITVSWGAGRTVVIETYIANVFQN